MALPQINITDFQGVLRLSRDTFEQEHLQNYINTFYPQIIEDLIGIEALEEIQQLNPLPQKWYDLIYGVTYENTIYDKKKKIKGLRWIALQYIYFHFVRNYLLHTNTGFVTNKNENSYDQLYSNSNTLAIQQYNKGVREFNDNVIDFFCEYDLVKQNITSFVYDGINMLWTINTDCTKYLLNGDSVKIDSIEYSVQNLVKDTSFQILADELTFTIQKLEYTYQPFEIIDYCFEYFATI